MGWLGRLPSLRWIGRFIAGAVLLDVLVQFQIFQYIPGLGNMEPRCYKYDPVARPGMFRVLGSSFNTTQPPEILFKISKGIVMTASGNITRQAAGAFVTAYVFRHILHTDIPIEIFYAGEDEAFHSPIKEALASLPNVYLLDLHQALHALYTKGGASHPPPSLQTLRSYAAKVYAVQASSFRENLLMDAGAVPFVGPEAFFALPSYQANGMAIFSDYVAVEKARWGAILRRGLCLNYKEVYRAFNGRELDSSCVVFDKVKNADALNVAVALNGPLQRVTYETLLGDKDTWALAMMHVGKTISVTDLEPGYLLVSREKGKARKVTGHLQFLKESPTSTTSLSSFSSSSSSAAPSLLPMHHNNQLLDFREYPSIANQTYMQIFSNLGDVLIPGSRRRDCRHFPLRELMTLPTSMHEAYVAVAEALKEWGIDHCICRDDWISCEEDIERLRKERWTLRLIDALGPKKQKYHRFLRNR